MNQISLVSAMSETIDRRICFIFTLIFQPLFLVSGLNLSSDICRLAMMDGNDLISKGTIDQEDLVCEQSQKEMFGSPKKSNDETKELVNDLQSSSLAFVSKPPDTHYICFIPTISGLDWTRAAHSYAGQRPRRVSSCFPRLHLSSPRTRVTRLVWVLSSRGFSNFRRGLQKQGNGRIVSFLSSVTSHSLFDCTIFRRQA